MLSLVGWQGEKGLSARLGYLGTKLMIYKTCRPELCKKIMMSIMLLMPFQIVMYKPPANYLACLHWIEFQSQYYPHGRYIHTYIHTV